MNRLKPTIVYKLLATSAVLLALHGTLYAEDLYQLYQQALQRDPLWANARATQQARNEIEPQAQAGLLPTVSLNAGYTQNDQDVTMPASTSNSQFGAENYSLNISQPLYRKQNLETYTQSKLLTSLAESELRLAREDLILRTANSYFAVLSAEDQLEYARAEKNTVGRQLALAKRQFEVGSGNLSDRHAVQARYDLAVAEELSAETAVFAARENLRASVGDITSPLAKLAIPLQLSAPEPADVEQWIQLALAHNAQVRSAELNEQAAQQGIEVSRSGHYPTLDLIASHSYSDSYSIFGSPLTVSSNQIGVALTVPLYTGGGTSSRVREAAARHDAQRQTLDYVRRQTTREIRDMYLVVINNMSRIQALELAHTSNQRALESMLIGYERGQRSGVDLLTAQRELFRTKRDLSSARYTYLLSRLRLEAAAGQLDEEDVTQLNARLAR